MRIGRPRLSMGATLALAFGSMLAVSLMAVLVLSFYVGADNTRSLLADRTNLTLDAVVLRVQSYLSPVEEELAWVDQAISRGEVVIEQPSDIRAFLRGVMAATPQIGGVALVKPDLTGWSFGRSVGIQGEIDWRQRADIKAAVADARGRFGTRWGEPVWSETADGTIINARRPLYRNGEFVGVMLAAVTLETIVQHIRELSDSLRQPVFVLHGRAHGVAHPALDPHDSNLGPHHPLPTLAELGDPVLARLWSSQSREMGLIAGLIRGEGERVEANGQAYAVVWREISGFTDLPWVVGTYLPVRTATAEMLRLWRAAALSAALTIAAILATFYLGVRIARPVRLLAERANAITTLESRALQPLPASSIREVDDAGRAFNALQGALVWFETYLPKRLVRRLMEISSPDAIPSRELEVTVLFTDIVGFSRLAEHLDASATATLLNHHFDVLASCIALTDGTIDKYIGDGLMAFWGVPSTAADHAQCAVGAAIAMRDAMRQADMQPRLRLRIGIHTGPALVGNIGARERINFTLVGDTVNIAQRLEQLGKEVAPNEDVVILASASTVKELAGTADIRFIGPRPLRGRHETVEVYRIL